MNYLKNGYESASARVPYPGKSLSFSANNRSNSISGDPHSYYSFAAQLTKGVGLTPMQQSTLYQQQQMFNGYANGLASSLYGSQAASVYGNFGL